MSEIRFYHLTRSTIAQALPDLLEKTLTRGWRAVVRVTDEGAAERLNAQLWTYKAESFLPHGWAKEGHADAQPIWITDHDENPNGAQVLFLLNGAGAQEVGGFDLCCELFDGNDSEIAQQARDRWVRYKREGHKLTYWQQGEKGWTNKGE